MPTALILGGSGKVARHLTSQLVKKSYTVHSIIRNPSQSGDLESLGARPIVQSIEDSSVADLASTIKKTSPNVIIWSAGAGGGSPERTKSVDHLGAVKAFDAAAEAGVKRFILVSAVDVRDRENKPEPEWYNDEDRDRSERVWNAIGVYMKAKFAADRDLVTNNARRGLEYTIVRPGGLSTEPGTGKVDAGKVHLAQQISREDVATVVVECIENEGTKGLAFDVVGGETGIEEAVGRVAKEKVDTFHGRY
ncbi:hypothetical protein H2203_000491 [Taxawa tesnikishii (nom. ined.)]|nr:hypothetical protein H2203_000491 [Dothideales sp. JES 119]